MNHKLLCPPTNNSNDETINSSIFGFSRNTKRGSFYDTIINFSTYIQMQKHSESKNLLVDFINFQRQKAFFLFGPTGCGKTLFVTHFLKKYKIPYEECSQTEKLNQNYDDNGIYENSDPKREIITLRETIDDCLKDTAITRVCLFRDFPMVFAENNKDENYRNFQFKRNFFKNLPTSSCKFIFILNSDIYSPYSITSSVTDLSIVKSIQIKNYTKTDLKKFIKAFLEKYPQFGEFFDHQVADNLAKISNGDARKLLLDIYLHSIEKSNQKSKKKSKSMENDCKKISIFHGLGKYLYAKRYDEKSKKDRVFTKEELTKADPPFYFQPVQMLEKMGTSIKIFEDLIIQNYLKRFGSIEDVSNICELFVHLDSKFPFYTTRKHLKEHQEKELRMYTFLLTWGTILKNKHASQVKTAFTQFSKFIFSFVQKQREKKRQLIRKYYKGYKIKNLINLSYIVRGTTLGLKCVIVEILKNRIHKNFQLGEDTKMIEEEEQSKIQDDFIGMMGNQQKIWKIMKKNYIQYQSYRIAERQMQAEEQSQSFDSSDIDQQ